MKDFSNLEKLFKIERKQYSVSKLEESSLTVNPFEQFGVWLEEAINVSSCTINYMTLSTAMKSGPSSRMMLLKGFTEQGFVFYTGWESKKAKEISENPNVTMLFFWPELERQVVVHGTAEKISESDADRYFKTRPRFSQLSAWASEQSKPILNRQELETKFSQMEKKFKDKEVPRPPYWGGYRVIPSSFEFWQGRENRLNDRILYRKEKNNWMIQRLQP